MAQVVECPSHNLEALSLTPSTSNKQTNKQPTGICAVTPVITEYVLETRRGKGENHCFVDYIESGAR
jgi:hypothetical protein